MTKNERGSSQQCRRKTQYNKDELQKEIQKRREY